MTFFEIIFNYSISEVFMSGAIRRGKDSPDTHHPNYGEFKTQFNYFSFVPITAGTQLRRPSLGINPKIHEKW